MNAQIHNVPVIRARLTVVLDNLTPGSEGRLCLTFPKELADEIGGNCYHVRGHLETDNAILLVHSSLIDPTHDEAKCITTRMQLWWKNGVRDHGIRQNWYVNIYFLDRACLVVMLDRPTGDPKPKLPPQQMVAFP